MCTFEKKSFKSELEGKILNFWIFLMEPFFCFSLLNLWAYHFSHRCCRKGDPFQGPKLGSCLTLRNELSEETHVLTKQEILLGKGTRVESSRVREPRRTALPRGSQSRVLWWRDSFPGGLWPIILIQSLSWWCMHRLAKMDASKRDSGKWTDIWCLL